MPEPTWSISLRIRREQDTREMLDLHRINPDRWTAKKLADRMGYDQEVVQRVLDGEETCLSR